mmetsp:Transcript_109544/g.244779  ORF Transcript_109544/g.244779 Transcript_109544/m.244779 type:complete len:81 (+) Transcript_109544:448-690(+)
MLGTEEVGLVRWLSVSGPADSGPEGGLSLGALSHNAKGVTMSVPKTPLPSTLSNALCFACLTATTTHTAHANHSTITMNH